MQFYLAPMEEVTGYVFRNVYRNLFGDMDKYFTPFLAPTQKKILKTKEQKEVDPSNNRGMKVVPQILTNNPQHFLETAEYLSGLGYREINLNLGCPSPTVVSRHRGSGFLADPDALDLFFHDIFQKVNTEASRFHKSDTEVQAQSALQRPGNTAPQKSNTPVPQKSDTPTSDQPEQRGAWQLSVKTRIGLSSPEEFPAILEIYNRYPLSELILHPRVQKDFYKNHPHMDTFRDALQNCHIPLCYNGDIFSARDFAIFHEQFPSISRVMLGRGVVANPGLVREIRSGQKITLEELQLYEKMLFEGYVQAYGDANNAVYKMKEVWYYLSASFQNPHKQLKKIRKSTRPEQYRQAVEEAFCTLQLTDGKEPFLFQ